MGTSTSGIDAVVDSISPAAARVSNLREHVAMGTPRR
jgi:hypothetical protein